MPTNTRMSRLPTHHCRKCDTHYSDHDCKHTHRHYRDKNTRRIIIIWNCPNCGHRYSAHEMDREPVVGTGYGRGRR